MSIGFLDLFLGKRLFDVIQKTCNGRIGVIIAAAIFVQLAQIRSKFGPKRKHLFTFGLLFLAGRQGGVFVQKIQAFPAHSGAGAGQLNQQIDQALLGCVRQQDSQGSIRFAPFHQGNLPRNLELHGFAQEGQGFHPILVAQDIIGDLFHLGQSEKAHEIHQRAPGIAAA